MRQEKGRFWTKYDKIQQAEQNESIDNLNGSLYAILFNADITSGDIRKGYSNDVGLVYGSLLGTGMPHSNIVTLEGHGYTRSFVNAPATLSNLESALNSLRQTAKSNDRLLVFVTNHGELVNGQCFMAAYNGRISESDFGEMVHDLPTNFALFYFSQCYSGGFAERVGYGRDIGISNTGRDRKSYHLQSPIPIEKIIAKDGNFFTRYLFPSILERGRTIDEAFDIAVKKDTSLLRFLSEPMFCNWDTEIPQLRWQNADPSRLYLGNKQ